VAKGELFNAKSGTPGFKLAFEILDGEYAGRRLWLDIWLSEAALGMAKRDLGKLGVEHPEQLERPLPEGIIAVVKVVFKRSDDGSEFNRVKTFEVVAVEPPELDPFAPGDAAEPLIGEAAIDDGFDWSNGKPTGGYTR
jgi:hypothetical protein